MINQLSSIPNFFLIGAMKGGTTALYEILKDHPQIFFPKIKEPHYFVHPDRPFVYHGPKDQEIADSIFRFKERDYLALYPRELNEDIVGDASAMYLYYHEASKNIFEFNQDAKILMVLRNPVDRAYSSFLHLVRDYREDRSFEEGLDLEKERIKDGFNPLWHYKSAGLYSSMVENYFRLFSHIKIIIYDEFKENPNEVLKSICEFLEIQEFKFNLNQSFNVSGVPKSRLLHQSMKNPHPFKKVFKHLVPEKLRNSIKNSIINSNLAPSPKLDDSTRDRLTDYFKSDIEKLEVIIDKSLETWKGK